MSIPLLYKWAELEQRQTTDKGYLAHCALRAAFGQTAPQPFVLRKERVSNGSLDILGYGQADVCDLHSQLKSSAPPLLAQAIPAATILGNALPSTWKKGAQYRFSVRCCPIVRTRTGRNGHRERDIYLAACERSGDKTPDREEVYVSWLKKELGRNDAAICRSAQLTAFRLMRPVRRKGKGRAVRMNGLRPDVHLSGVLEVTNPHTFPLLLARGCGRHRAFGYGMLLLQAL